MLSFATCANVPVRGGRGGYGGGGLVEVEGRVVWGGDMEGVYMLDEVRSKWSRVADGAVVHGDMVFVMGGLGMDRAVWCADIRDLQSIWRQLPDVPYCLSSVCVGDGVLLAIGGAEDLRGSKKTSSIYGLHGDDKKWKHVGDMPFACSRVDTLLLSDGGLLVVDGYTQQVLRITVQGLAKLFPITPTVKETGKSQKEADERYLTGEPLSTAVVFRLVLYEEAMSKGYVETSVTKCLILGAAGVGKTHLKHLLLKKDPPEQRVSTGLADNPVRAISFSLAGVGGQEEDDWFVVEDDQALLRVVGGTIRDGGVSMATSLEEVVSSFPKMTIHVSSDGAGAVHPDPTPARVNVTMDTGQQSRTVSIEEELIHHINHSSEELSHQPTIEYYGADGKPDARPLIVTVGTHRDAADRCSESIKDKNHRVMELLDAGRFRVLCNGEELTEAIFAVNGKTPQDEDRVVAKVLRKKIVSLCSKLMKMPIAWFGLDVLLQRSSHDEVLPQTVFCDPQVVLTKVTELVEYHHKLRDSPDKGVAAERDLVKFRDHGLLSVELLKKFSKHYTEVKRVIEYLMPALLPHLDSGQVSKYCQPAFIPNQPFTLEGVHGRDKPLSLYRNCITFQLKHTTELVTLVDMFSTFCCILTQFSGTVPVTLDSEPSLQHLMEKVAAVIPSKYEMVGLQLGLTPAQLQAIRPQHQSLEDYHRAFGEILDEWRRRGSPPLHLGDIDWCVEKCSVGEVLLSEQLTSWITQQ
eukprot:Em0002g243a